MTTDRAGATRVGWIHEDDRYPGFRGLVDNELPQLSERPVVQAGPLAAPGFYPVADTPEVFQGDAAAEPLRLGYNSFGDPVVDIPLVSLLASGDLPEFPTGRPRTPLLQARPSVDVNPPFFFDRLTAVGLRLAVREHVHRPEVAA
jgi:hypothetical protein